MCLFFKLIVVSNSENLYNAFHGATFHWHRILLMTGDLIVICQHK